jgi:hypothetical protein
MKKHSFAALLCVAAVSYLAHESRSHATIAVAATKTDTGTSTDIGRAAVSNTSSPILNRKALVPLSAEEETKIQDYLRTRYSAADVRHSFLTKAGQTIDCVDILATPAAKDSAAKGLSLSPNSQTPPPPAGMRVNSGNPTDEDWFNGYPDSNGHPRACPKGTSPLVRPSADEIQAAGGLAAFKARSEEHHSAPPAYECPSFPELFGYAHVVKTTAIAGPSAGITEGSSHWMLYNPKVESIPPTSSGHSITQVWLTTGCGINIPSVQTPTCNNDAVGSGLVPCMRTVEAGTISYANDNVLHFIVYATNNGYQNGVLFTSMGFLANGQILYGSDAGNYGWPGGIQQSVLVQIIRYSGQPGIADGYWIWVTFNPGSSNTSGGWVGYYGLSGFTGSFYNGADSFQIGGEVAEQNQAWINRMGSGADPNAGFGQATYFFAGESFVVNGTGTHSNFVLGQANSSSSTGSTRPSDYGMVSDSGGFYVGNLPHKLWGTNYGYNWNPLSYDWAGGEYKGECYNGAYITGMSKFTSGLNQVNAIQCGPDGQQPSGVPSAFSFHAATVRRTTDGNWDWDYGYYKGECAANEIVQGVAQTTGGYLDALLCYPSTINQARSQTTCNVQSFYSGDSAGYVSSAVPDWDYGHYKAQCNYGQYVAGVSTVASTANGVVGAPHAILCCSP